MSSRSYRPQGALFVLTTLDASITESPEHTTVGRGVSTHLKPQVLEAWRAASGDPDVYAARWLREGAPAGLSRLPEHAGVFSIDEDPNVDHLGLTPFGDGAIDDCTYFESSEDQALMWEEIASLEHKGFVRRFGSAKEVQSFLESDFYESRLFILRQEKSGVVKTRALGL